MSLVSVSSYLGSGTNGKINLPLPLTGVHVDEILESFGEVFLDVCMQSGYQPILEVLGSSMEEFFQHLDCIHEHLSSTFPGMQAPSFSCTRREDGVLSLRYYSSRSGFEHMVIGLLRAVAKKLLHVDLTIQIVSTKEGSGGYSEFHITERGESALPYNHTDSEPEATEPKVSPNTFCRAFPFHIIFDRNMKIVQYGTSIARILPQMRDRGCKVTDLLEIMRPRSEFKFETILEHINSLFVLRTKRSSVRPSCDLLEHGTLRSPLISLKGEMVHDEDNDYVLYLCSPSVKDLDDLSRCGLYLSDIPLHDATREMVLLTEHFQAEYKLTQKLETLTDQLQETYRDLEEEMRNTDR